MPRARSSLPLLTKVPVLRSARAAGLIYMHDDQPGISRLRRGRGFWYRHPRGRAVGARHLIRIRSLAIPPAWQRVWISPVPNSHLQATGFDARGRKQYRYHPDWQNVRNVTKFHRLTDFGQALPIIRARLEQALSLPGLPREKVLACVIRLLDMTGIRVGNEEYAEANGSFGLTTLRNRHVEIDGSRLRFRFRGKSGVQHRLELVDRRLARVVERCSDLPGEMLFQYLDDEGQAHPIGSADVNAVLHEWTGADFTAKDFRTWTGTVLFFKVVCAVDAAAPLSVKAAVSEVARELRNTPPVCRKYYIHPGLLTDFTAGKLIAQDISADQAVTATSAEGLDALEQSVLRYLSKLPKLNGR